MEDIQTFLFCKIVTSLLTMSILFYYLRIYTIFLRVEFLTTPLSNLFERMQGFRMVVTIFVFERNSLKSKILIFTVSSQKFYNFGGNLCILCTAVDSLQRQMAPIFRILRIYKRYTSAERKQILYNHKLHLSTKQRIFFILTVNIFPKKAMVKGMTKLQKGFKSVKQN